MNAELLEAYSRRIAESDATIDYLRRRCEIQERLIAAFEKLCEGTTFYGSQLVDYRQAKAGLAELEKEHGDG